MKKGLYTLLIIILSAIIITPFFYKLDADPVKIWDESRYAVNALEMNCADNPLIVTYNGKPDYWNSKPPLAIWIMSASMELIGYNELGLRFPSAMAGVLSVLAILLFFYKIVRNINVGILVVLSLISSRGIIRYHVTRTGDVDALLVFFTVIYALSFFALLIAGKKHRKLFSYLFGAGVLCAFLTKGIAGLVPLPGLLVITCIHNNYKTVFTNINLYISVGIAVLLGSGYYLTRNYFDTTYLDEVFKQDFSMYTTESSKKNFGLDYYFNRIIKHTFYPFAYFLPVSFILAFFTKYDKLKKTMIYSSVFFLTFLIIITLSNTQNPWYDAPAYPFMAILFGGSLFVIFELSKKYIQFINPNIQRIVFIAIFVFILISPYKKMMRYNAPTKNLARPSWDCNYMRHLYSHKKEFKNYTVSIYKKWPDQVRFYQTVYNKNPEYNIKLKSKPEYEKNEIVLTCHEATRCFIEKNYKYEIVDKKSKNCKMYKILKKIE